MYSWVHTLLISSAIDLETELVPSFPLQRIEFLVLGEALESYSKKLLCLKK